MFKYEGPVKLKLIDRETGIETEMTMTVNLLKPFSLVSLSWSLVKDFEVTVIN